MAMTGRIIFWGYKKNQYDLKNAAGTPATQGVQFNLTNQFCNVYPAPASTVANGVTMQSVIEFLPPGLYHNGQSDKYYSADPVATLQTNGT